jgi:hypothetical protein
MRRRAALLAPLAMLPSVSPAGAAEPPVGDGYSSEAIRRRAEAEARRRAAWWARQRARETDERIERERERQREATRWQVERWEEQRTRRLWGRRDLWP